MRRLLAGLSFTAIAASQPCAGLPWTRVAEVPATHVYSVDRHGTSVYAGTTDAVHIGADDGTTWTGTVAIDPAAAGVEAVLPVDGALWAGTYGRGVHRSADGGASWQAVNAGLVGLGATAVVALVEKGGKLYAGTAGAGVFVLDPASPDPWSPFDAGYPVATAGTVAALVLHGTTLVAPAGGNGFVYRFPEGATVWQEVAIVPPILPGMVATDLVQSAEDLFVATTHRVYRSSDDAQTWTFAGTGLASGTEFFLAASGPLLFAGVDYQGDNHRLYRSTDRGDTWQMIDTVPGSYLYGLEVAGDRLFAARSDGLWWTPLAVTNVRGTDWATVKGQFRQ